MFTDSSKNIQHYQNRLRTHDEIEKYFPGFLSFIDSTEQQIPRPINNKRRKIFYSGKKKRYTAAKTQQLVVNKNGLSFTKQDIRKEEGMNIISETWS